jgi:aminoglycoside phosphotransferase (APT) family kinase protein
MVPVPVPVPVPPENGTCGKWFSVQDYREGRSAAAAEPAS